MLGRIDSARVRRGPKEDVGVTVEDRQNAARDETVDGAIEPETRRRGAIPDGAGWRNLWQIPTLVVSLALIATALLVGRASPGPPSPVVSSCGGATFESSTEKR